MDDGLRIWRNFQMGDLFDLIMLDTRHYDRSVTDLGKDSGLVPTWDIVLIYVEWGNFDYINMIHDDAGRTLMGARQESWYQRQLSQSQKRGAKWRVVGSQLRFARLEYEEDGELTYSGDGWDVSIFSIIMPAWVTNQCGRHTAQTKTVPSSTSTTTTSRTPSCLLVILKLTGFVLLCLLYDCANQTR